jgi:hypothetical protein
VTPRSADGDSTVSLLGGGCEDETPWVPPPPPPPPPPFEYPYYEVRQAATDIESGDQGTAFRAFSREWDAFQRALQKETYRFRPFTSWEGEARITVEQNFELHRQWIYGMTAVCTALGKQADSVVDAHKKARVYGEHVERKPDGTWANDAEHPTTYEVSQCDYWYKYYSQNYNGHYLYMAVSWYESLQAKSETSLKTYVANASLPLAPVNPKAPPAGARIDPPPAPNPNPDPGPNPNPNPNPDVGPGDPTNSDLADALNNLSDSTSTPSVPSMPSTPPTPAMPPTDPKLTQALKDLKGKGGLPGGAGMKPASLGGGAGVPSMPLQPSADGEAGPRPAAGAAPGLGNLGKGLAGAGGATGGGGMGGMPMGGQGAGQGKEGKRKQGDDESLYTEDRAWTEGVIGRRRAKDAPDH